MRVLAGLNAALLNQRGHLLPWSPVCLAVGIGAYFALRFEPAAAWYACLIALAICAGCAGVRGMSACAPVMTGVAVIACGFVLAGLRAHLVAEPILQWRYYGPVEGRVVALDRSGRRMRCV